MLLMIQNALLPSYADEFYMRIILITLYQGRHMKIIRRGGFEFKYIFYKQILKSE